MFSNILDKHLLGGRASVSVLIVKENMVVIIFFHITETNNDVLSWADKALLGTF